jgi:hypothetical protein
MAVLQQNQDRGPTADRECSSDAPACQGPNDGFDTYDGDPGPRSSLSGAPRGLPEAESLESCGNHVVPPHPNRMQGPLRLCCFLAVVPASFSAHGCSSRIVRVATPALPCLHDWIPVPPHLDSPLNLGQLLCSASRR